MRRYLLIAAVLLLGVLALPRANALTNVSLTYLFINGTTCAEATLGYEMIFTPGPEMMSGWDYFGIVVYDGNGTPIDALPWFTSVTITPQPTRQNVVFRMNAIAAISARPITIRFYDTVDPLPATASAIPGAISASGAPMIYETTFDPATVLPDCASLPLTGAPTPVTPTLGSGTLINPSLTYQSVSGSICASATLMFTMVVTGGPGAAGTFDHGGIIAYDANGTAIDAVAGDVPSGTTLNVTIPIRLSGITPITARPVTLRMYDTNASVNVGNASAIRNAISASGAPMIYETTFDPTTVLPGCASLPLGGGPLPTPFTPTPVTPIPGTPPVAPTATPYDGLIACYGGVQDGLFDCVWWDFRSPGSIRPDQPWTRRWTLNDLRGMGYCMVRADEDSPLYQIFTLDSPEAYWIYEQPAACEGDSSRVVIVYSGALACMVHLHPERELPVELSCHDGMHQVIGELLLGEAGSGDSPWGPWSVTIGEDGQCIADLPVGAPQVFDCTP